MSRWSFIGAMVALVLLSGCGDQTVPYNSNSPAAKIRDQKLEVPVVGGDDYMKTNMAFSPVTIDYFEKQGRKSIKAYSDVRRLTQTHADNDDFRFTIIASLALEKSGSTIRTISEKITNTNRLDLNDLCTEDNTIVPDRIVISMVRVEKETKRPIVEEKGAGAGKEPAKDGAR